MGYSPELLGLSGEKIISKFLDVTKSGRNNGIDISISKSTQLKAGVFGMILSVDEKNRVLSLKPFDDKTCVIEFVNCGSFIKKNGFVAPWTSIVEMQLNNPPDSIHLQISNDDIPTYPHWPINYLDPEKFKTSDLLNGNWLYHYEGPNPNGYPSIINSTYQISDTTINSVFPFNRNFIVKAPFGTFYADALWNCTIQAYTDTGVKIFAKFISCNGNINCGGADFNFEIVIVDTDSINGSVSVGGSAILKRVSTALAAFTEKSEGQDIPDAKCIDLNTGNIF